MSITRRDALLSGAWLSSAALALADSKAEAAPSGKWDASYSGAAVTGHPAPGEPGKDYRPVVTPNSATLPFKVVDGVKVFHLVAEEVDHEFAPGLRAKCWGYNGQVHGPTIEAVEGDRVRVYVTNRLPEPTTVHWHAVFVPNGMDGVAGLNQRAIHPGETYKYEWTFRQFGTFMYHPHHDEMTQMALGMMGMIVVHPRNATPDDAVDRDFALLLGEWSIPIGAARPNPNEMTEFNVLTMNAKCFPGTDPLVTKRGDRVRIRIGNLSAMDHHPIHLHGHRFKIVATDGGSVPLSAIRYETTVLVPVGSTRTIEFLSDAPGDWAMHCHMSHHVMNQMGHGTPNMTGVDAGSIDDKAKSVVPDYMTMGQTGMGDMGAMGMPVPSNSIPMAGAKGPFGEITMGGMFTILKVRETVDASGADPGPYQEDPSRIASLATAEELARDGVEVKT